MRERNGGDIQPKRNLAETIRGIELLPSWRPYSLNRLAHSLPQTPEKVPRAVPQTIYLEAGPDVVRVGSARSVQARTSGTTDRNFVASSTQVDTRIVIGYRSRRASRDGLLSGVWVACERCGVGDSARCGINAGRVVQGRIAHHLEERFRVVYAGSCEQYSGLPRQLLVQQGNRPRLFIRCSSEHEKDDVLGTLSPGVFVAFYERVTGLPESPLEQ